MSGPLLLALESSCDETGIAVIDGARFEEISSGRSDSVADSREPY